MTFVIDGYRVIMYHLRTCCHASESWHPEMRWEKPGYDTSLRWYGMTRFMTHIGTTRI